MKKAWNAPEMEELNIKSTANGSLPDTEFDSDWIQSPEGFWYRKGTDTSK